MILKSVSAAIPNGVIFIEDRGGGVAPEPVRGAMLLSTPSCIAVACMIDSEGRTEVVVGDAEALDHTASRIFEGALETPTRVISVTTVEGKTLLESPVTETQTHIQIWVNRPNEPDKVIIGLG